MSKRIQIAFKLAEDDLEAVDALIPMEYESRAALLRAAVRALLEERRQAGIDCALEAGYADVPPTDEESRWAEISVEGLAGADLDW